MIKSPPILPLVVGLAGLEPRLSCLQDLLSELSGTTRLAFLVAVPPDVDEVVLDEIVHSLSIQELHDQTQLQAGQTYLVPLGSALSLTKDGIVSLSASGDEAVDDAVLKAIAETYRGEAVGILLSGRHGAGAIGLRSIREVGGLTMMEPLTERKQQPLLHEVDHILGPVEMAAELTLFAQSRVEGATGVNDISNELREALPEICRLVHEVTGHDLRQYKKLTLLRRVNRLIQIKHLESAQAYVDYLKTDDQAVRRLLDEVLIQVTSFFRDSEAFESLSKEVLKPLLAQKTVDQEVRIWVPGCCTGEEVYSLAMLCCEAVDSDFRARKVRLFGTDVSSRALATARRGEYAMGIEAQVSPERLERFFDRQGDRFVVSTRIREMCLFASQNLVGDPPFSDIDLVSCRNVLIYLGSTLQKKLMSIFHYAIKPGGYLFLGPSETLPAHEKLFRDVNPRFRIYQRRNVEARPWISFEPAQPGRQRIAVDYNSPSMSVSGRQSTVALSKQILLDDFSPPYAVVSEDGTVDHLFGETREFLNPSVESGIEQMARPGLQGGLRDLLAEARLTKRRAVSDRHSVATADGEQPVRLIVQPLPSLEEDDSYMVVFQKVGKPRARLTGEDPKDIREPRDEEIRRLEREVADTRSELACAIQADRAAHEELKSYNEELRSMNEELQSSNEELRLSQEETQAAHRQSRAAKTDLENLLDSTEIATVFVDRAQRVQGYTPASTEILNLIPSDIGRPYAHLTHRLVQMPPLPPVDSEASEVTVEGVSGRSYLRRVLPYRQLDRSVQGSVITFIDVTALKKAQEQLRASDIQRASDLDEQKKREGSLTAARDIAITASELKTRFHASVSHELRTPLAGLSGMIEMLLATRMTARQTDFVQTIQHCSDSLRHLIDDMLDLARMEIDKLALYPTVCDVGDFLHRVTEPFRYLSSKSGVKMVTKASGLPPFLVFDSSRVQQILNNLIGNSLKFTSDGSVTLEVTCTARTEDMATLKFAVSDTGSGISEEERRKIFLPFIQGEEGSDRKYGGLGLGLSISRQLITMMGGTIEVASETGEGSCFWFELELPIDSGPAKPVRQRSKTPSHRAEARVGRILVAEDNLINQRVIAMQLEKLGHSVTMVGDGRQALELLEASEEAFDLVILDCQMPGLDGYETSRRIRLSQAAFARVPILALTAHAMTGDQNACTMAGMDAYLRKPASIGMLEEAIGKLWM